MNITGGPPYSAPQAPPAPRDTTRTIAVVALVLAGVAVLGQLASMALPMLAFGAFGLLGSEGESFGGSWDPGVNDPGMGEAYGVAVPAYAGQEVSAGDLSAALTALDAFAGRLVRCEACPRSAPAC